MADARRFIEAGEQMGKIVVTVQERRHVSLSLPQFRMGDLDLPNRIVMAPLTRIRAGPIDHVPTAPQAE